MKGKMNYNLKKTTVKRKALSVKSAKMEMPKKLEKTKLKPIKKKTTTKKK
jgi:hypothetical protein